MHCRTFSNILAVYPADASSTHTPSCDNHKCLSLDIAKCPPKEGGGEIVPSYEPLI